MCIYIYIYALIDNILAYYSFNDETLFKKATRITSNSDISYRKTKSCRGPGARKLSSRGDYWGPKEWGSCNIDKFGENMFCEINNNE